MTSPAGRPLDPAGRYFAVLDQLWPANVVCGAELDTVFAADEVAAAWQDVCTANPVARSRLGVPADGPPFLVGDPAVSCDFRPSAGALEAVIADEQRTRFDVAAGPLVRCRYLAGDGGSVVLVTGHHAVLDGRGGYVLLQQLAGVLAGAGPPAQRPLPPGLQDGIRPGLRWPQDRRPALGLLREMAGRRQQAGPLDAVALDPAPPPSSAAREPAVSLHRFNEDATRALLARARATGASGHGIISAAWLQAVHELIGDGRPAHHLSLTTPADLRARLDPPVPADVAGMFASMVGTSHVVGDGDLGDLARGVSRQVQAAVDRGEGELFFALARADTMALDGRGAATLRTAIEAAPQTIAVSNTGRLPAGSDPAWVRRVWFVFGPSPNQLLFVSATTYRDRLTLAAAVDRARLPADAADRLVTSAVRRLAAAAAE